ncbi:hypothetical protein LINPERPRIM_LOCUS23296 [Linum perenne]
MLYVTASGTPNIPNTASEALLIPDDGPVYPPPPCRRSDSAALLMTTVIARQIPRMRFTPPHRNFAPNFLAKGSIAKETIRRTIELIINPIDPARTPWSYIWILLEFIPESPPYTSLPIQSVLYSTHGNHANQLRHVTSKSIHVGLSRLFNALKKLVNPPTSLFSLSLTSSESFLPSFSSGLQRCSRT